MALNTNKDYVIKGLNWWLISSTCTLNFAFNEKNTDVLAEMKRVGMLEHKYIDNPAPDSLKPIGFEKFDGAETLSVACFCVKIRTRNFLVSEQYAYYLRS